MSIMKLWITYAWKDNQDGDFDYLVQELAKIGVEAKFDKVSIIPGQRLWQQIGDHILKGEYDGWASLVTVNSLNSEPCKEELEYAVTRAIQSRSTFPIMGLIHGVQFENLPASLKTRLCVSLSNSDWKEQIKAGLEGRAPDRIVETLSQFVMKISSKNSANGTQTTIEIKPRFGEITNWRIAVPEGVAIKSWGWGAANGTDAMSGIQSMVLQNVTGISLNDIPVVINGCGDRLTQSIAAKIIFENSLPSFIAFGVSDDPFGMPTKYEPFQIS